MFCPFCSNSDTKVIDSRLIAEGCQVKRRRKCLSCRERFTTVEIVQWVMPRVIKNNGSREVFSEDKLRNGLLRALEKRSVSLDAIDQSAHRIQSKLRALGEREIPSALIGNFVMDELKQLDKVAYIRFASVYRCFEDVCQFREEIAKLEE